MNNDHLIPRQLRKLWDYETPEELLTVGGGKERSDTPDRHVICDACGKKIYYDGDENTKIVACPYCGHSFPQ